MKMRFEFLDNEKPYYRQITTYDIGMHQELVEEKILAENHRVLSTRYYYKYGMDKVSNEMGEHLATYHARDFYESKRELLND